MPECLDNLTIINRCNNSHYASGRTGNPIAIVFQSVGVSAQAYDSLLATSLPPNYYTNYPRSVHYFISYTGIITQYVETSEEIDSFPSGIKILEFAVTTWPTSSRFPDGSNSII